MVEALSGAPRPPFHPKDAVVLYGAGGVGRDVLQVLTRDGVRVACVLDRRAQVGDTLSGVPVFRPETCPLSDADRLRMPVVLSLFNREVDAPGIANVLHAAGFARVVPFVDLHASFCDELGDRFWLTNRRVLTDRRAEIEEAESIWADEASRMLFRRLVAFRTEGAYHESLRPDPANAQYLPRDVPKWLGRRPIRFVDCGAYTGDTVTALLTQRLPLGALALFEPESHSFQTLRQVVHAHRQDIDGPATLWPCAVGSRCEMVNFREGFGESSSVAVDGGARVQAVSLDDVLCGWEPSFVKMDIEGAEMDGLVGARHLIAQSQPDLAICVYHRPDHLWQIPIMLGTWTELANYRYYLRVHGFEGFDTVLYACPGR
jgi:FkbM family methyltransferase